MRYRFALSALIALIIGSVVWSACHDDNKGECEVGTPKACICADGKLSQQMCMSSGVYAPCACDDFDLSVPPEPDLSVAQDLSPPPDMVMTPDMACAPVMNAKRVFVTSTTYKGDLKTEGAGTDGLDGGDKLCQSRADAATLGGTWKAWLSTSTVDAISRIGDVGPWYLPDRCHMVFSSKAAITSADPMIAINHNEMDSVVMNVTLWTGTADDGTFDGDGCTDWTDATNAVQGQVGTGAPFFIPGFWTATMPSNCDATLRLLCFEQ